MMPDVPMSTNSRRDTTDERREGAEGEMMDVETTKKMDTSTKKNGANEERAPTQESREDDWGASDRTKGEERDEPDQRDGRQDAAPKKSAKSPASKHKKSSSGGSKKGQRQPQDHGNQVPFQQLQGRMPYPGAAMAGNGGPHGPPVGPYQPPPYGYAPGGGQNEPFRGAPSHQYGQYPMPPLPHSGQQGYGHHGMPPGNFGGGLYHPPPHAYPGSYPMPYHGGMQQPQRNMPPFQQTTTAGPEDTGSIGSSKSSKGSKASKNSKSSTNSRKKRTIDGIDEMSQGQPQTLSSAFSFRRTHSSASTSSTITAGNNTSTDTPNLTEDSPQKGSRDRVSDLPPLSSRPDYQGSSLLDDNRRHRRDFSGTSTASSLSVGGLSLSSYGQRGSEDPLVRSSPKRRRGQDGGPLTDNDRFVIGESNNVPPARIQKLSMKDSEVGKDQNLFLTLSTSPINSDVEATPISKNTSKGNDKPSASHDDQKVKTLQSTASMESMNKMMDRGSDTPTPPLPDGSAESDMMTDEHLLNRHLRGQSFTPLPHIGNIVEPREGGNSPPVLSANPSFTTIGAQLSWDIAGDTPSLTDLGDWEGEDRQNRARPGSSASHASGTSPAVMALWKEAEGMPSSYYQQQFGGSVLSPPSDVDMGEEGVADTGATTPLPIFFGDHHHLDEERENGIHRRASSLTSRKDYFGSQVLRGTQFGDPEHIHQLFMNNGGRLGDKRGQNHWTMSLPGQQQKGMPGSHLRMPPTPVFTSSDQRDDIFGRSPLNGDPRDGGHEFFPKGMYPMHPGLVGQPPNDRVRNLRGRAPPGSQRGPMAHQLPPHLASSHNHNLTSPIMGAGSAVGKGGMWNQGHMGHQMSDSRPGSANKQKCHPLKPPIPTKFQGDIEKFKTAHVPEFTNLVNFPGHMSQTKASANLPDGVRCCVMCGQACPCSGVGKNKKANKAGKSGISARNGNVQEAEKQGYAIIPTQNKGLCTLCDVNVWVVAQSGLEIKWCKGCKNFRPWAAFGDKGLATKCLRCRDRQREKYALQKEEKERARLLAKAAKAAANKA